MELQPVWLLAWSVGVLVVGLLIGAGVLRRAGRRAPTRRPALVVFLVAWARTPPPIGQVFDSGEAGEDDEDDAKH